MGYGTLVEFSSKYRVALGCLPLEGGALACVCLKGSKLGLSSFALLP